MMEMAQYSIKADKPTPTEKAMCFVGPSSVLEVILSDPNKSRARRRKDGPFCVFVIIGFSRIDFSALNEKF